MLEYRPKDALGSLILTVSIEFSEWGLLTALTVLSVFNVSTELSVSTVLNVLIGFIEDLKSIALSLTT